MLCDSNNLEASLLVPACLSGLGIDLGLLFLTCVSKSMPRNMTLIVNVGLSLAKNC